MTENPFKTTSLPGGLGIAEAAFRGDPKAQGPANAAQEGASPGHLPGVKVIRLSKHRLVAIDQHTSDPILRRHWKWRVRAGKPMAYCTEPAALDRARTREVLMHRLVLDLGGDELVIHLNHNGLDNRRANLAVATKSEAAEHAKTRGRVPGVWRDGASSRWRAQAVVLLGVIDLGSFESDEAACRALEAAQTDAWLPKLPKSPSEAPDLPAGAQGACANPVASSSCRPPPLKKPRSNTGVMGVTRQNDGWYLVRVGAESKRFKSLRAAANFASKLITERRQREYDDTTGMWTTALGRYQVLVDPEVASWLWRTGNWTVRRRTDGSVEVRRPSVQSDDPDAKYLTPARYIWGAGPGERVEFINGDALDLRVANLRLV